MDKIIKGSGPPVDRVCQRHYFPDIAGDDLGYEGAKLREGHQFRRADFRVAGEGDPESLAVLNMKEEDKKRKGVAANGIAGSLPPEGEGSMVGKEKVLEPILDDLRRVLVDLSQFKRKLSAHAEEETVMLALAIARKIIGHEVGTNRELLLHVIREASKKIVDTEKIRIKVNPSDLALINETKFRVSNLVEHCENITVEGDDAITNGGCIIETNFGDIDARIEKQLEEIELLFKSELRKAE
ncbi:MAG: flagellar assembly protein FliH [Deltaproteobacteria bacterium]|nr:flagellar assembly protein FliH [Deltaproteobacteria bacterium]